MNISYPKNRIKVLLLENVHPNAQQMFSDEGYQVEIVSGSLDEEELCEKIKDVSVLGIRSKTQITQKVIDSAKRLIAIGAFCIGTNQIDLKACTKKGVVVFHAPYSNTRSVVELAIGEMIMLSRKTFVQSTNIHQGRWHKSANQSNEIRGKKLGIIGYGSIGSQLSVLAENMGMDVYYYDTDEKLALSNATKIDHLDTLLQTCDFITLHVDGNTSNTNLIGEREFELMKDGVIFLNLARGFVVDIKALAKYVKNGKVRGAAVDVYPEEPKASKSAFETQLKGLENVILTPHVGGSTEEAQANIGDFVPNNIINFVNKGNLAASVNIPPMQLPTFDGSHRLIHIHRNEPGIMSKINAVYAKFNLNIVGQYLKTTESIGYVITDIMKDYDDDVINELKKIEHTIKFRVLY
jgi:D-3-phosphoglycerate dehydrogenase